MSMFGCKRLMLAAAVAACAVGSSALAAPSIGINFVDNGNGGVQNGSSDSLTAGELAGAPGYTQTNWNNLGRWGQTVGVNDSTGAASGATVTWDSNNTWQDGADVGTPNGKLMHGYIDSLGKPNDNTTTPYVFYGQSNAGANDNRPQVYVTGLSAWLTANHATGYKVIVYADGDGTQRPAEFWLQNASVNDPPTILGSDLTPHLFLNDVENFSGTFTQVPGTATSLATAAPGNYMVFEGLTGDSFLLRTEEQTFRAAINGVQIVAVVPEPASLGLLAIGAVGLLGRRRRA